MTASSPCVRLCLIDDASGLCRGCGRTLAEIADWGRFSEPQRLATMATLQQRLQLSGRTTGVPSGTRASCKPDGR